MPGGTLFPDTMKQYDDYTIREALHNCIAHQDYTMQQRINFVENPTYLYYSNAGSFIPGTLENALTNEEPQAYFRNECLCRAMVVINTLIAAAQNGKKVTVFVELKARFDEENNLATAEMMKRAGIHIIFSIPGLKVHAKVALVLRYNKEGKQTRSYAYISTGNFNEKTARIYADSGLFTSNEIIVNDLYTLFRVLQKEVTEPKFKRLFDSTI